MTEQNRTKKGSKKPKPSSFFKKMKVSMPFQSKKDVAGSFTKAYMTAFLLIAGISVVVHLITSSITQIQQASIKNTYLINQERTLIEQISASSSKHYTLGEKLDYDLLTQAIDQLNSTHTKIINNIQDQSLFNPRSPVLNELYYDAPFYIDKNINEFIEKAQTYTSYEPGDKSVERVESHNFIQRKSRSLLQPSLNKALADYQNEVIKRVKTYHTIQLGGLVFVLIVLLLEAAFIFHPLAVRTRIYHNMLLKQALEDPLTGLSNRRAFMNRSEAAMKRAYRDQEQLIVALTDLDHFKSVNDTYGHDIGDAVLKHFSAVLKKSLRGGDIIGRIGGEEFAVILPKTNYETGKEALERLCHDVENNPCPYVSEQGIDELLKYTVSIGYTNISSNQEMSVDELLKKADEALYEAKEGGRNRAVYAMA